MSTILNVKYFYPQDLCDPKLEKNYKAELLRILEVIKRIATDELEMDVTLFALEIDQNDPKVYISQNFPEILLVADVPNDDFDDFEEILIWLQKESIHLLKELESIFDTEVTITAWWRKFTCNYPMTD